MFELRKVLTDHVVVNRGRGHSEQSGNNSINVGLLTYCRGAGSSHDSTTPLCMANTRPMTGYFRVCLAMDTSEYVFA